MAEFLIRGYNVAVPEVDVGDDIFVVKDSSGDYARVQVKTALAAETRNGYSARYTVRFSQLEVQSVPEIWYIFANRLTNRWVSFVVISRQDLYDLYDLYGIGSLNRTGLLSLYFAYSADSVVCSGQNLGSFLNNWDDWPPIEHE
ncbi:MAG TPA: hypothetical protein P5121_22930 [Caldilineaceae bacterium]|nr:hypothetical protein [Caldilineaceae bacterium]